MTDFREDKQRKMEALRSQFGNEKIDALLAAGFWDYSIIEYLSGREGYSQEMKAVKRLLQAKALLEFHDVSNAAMLAAILVAPMGAPPFPSSFAIDDGVCIHGEVRTTSS